MYSTQYTGMCLFLPFCPWMRTVRSPRTEWVPALQCSTAAASWLIETDIIAPRACLSMSQLTLRWRSVLDAVTAWTGFPPLWSWHRFSSEIFLALLFLCLLPATGWRTQTWWELHLMLRWEIICSDIIWIQHFENTWHFIPTLSHQSIRGLAWTHVLLCTGISSTRSSVPWCIQFPSCFSFLVICCISTLSLSSTKLMPWIFT